MSSNGGGRKMPSNFSGKSTRSFARSLRSFLEKEVKPHQEECGRTARSPQHLEADGEQGFIGYWLDEKYGGPGPTSSTRS